MRGFLNYDGELFTALGKIADLILLNALTILFCIPVVTVGSSLTACHYVALKIRRGEGYVIRNFWKSFKANLIQSNVLFFIIAFMLALWVIMLGIPVSGESVSTIIKGLAIFVIISLIMIAVWIFPIQSKFIFNIKNAVVNSFILSFRHFFRTILMIVAWGVFVVLVLSLQVRYFWVVLLIGFSLPAYISALMYDKIFAQYEEAILKKETET